MARTAAGLDYRWWCLWLYYGINCPSPGKHPIAKGGLYRATQDEATIFGWWAIWPQANIGIRTGQVSGLLVLDVDPRNGGSESLEKLLSRYRELPDTLVCATGGGGWHYYFAYPGPGLVQLKGKVPGYPGLDIKCDGGYVVAPPSRHFSGGTYRWQKDWRTTAIAPVPEWLLELIRVEEKTAGRQQRCSTRGAELDSAMHGTDPGGPGDHPAAEGGSAWRLYRFLFVGDVEGAGGLRKQGPYQSQSDADLAMFNQPSPAHPRRSRPDVRDLPTERAPA